MRLEAYVNTDICRSVKEIISDFQLGRACILTLSPFFIESLSTENLCLNNDIGRSLVRNINNIFLCTAIIPRITAECLPDTQDRPVGCDVDAVGGEDVSGSGADV